MFPFTSQKLLLMGTGMIGVSLALSLKKSNPAIHIIGWDINDASTKTAKSLGAIDTYWSGRHLSQLLEKHHKDVQSLQLIVIAVPLNAYAAIFQALAPYVTSDVLITDVGSCKSFVIEVAQRFFSKAIAQFVPGHPIAGHEQSGAQAATADLFEKHRVILTPLPQNSQQTIAYIRSFWESIGALVEEMSAVQHDRMCAMISHMPHLLSFVLVYDVLRQSSGKDSLPYAAGGFRDFTRIAASDPQMWHDIFLSNQHILLEQLDHLQESLSFFRQFIEQSQQEGIHTQTHAGEIQPSAALLKALKEASDCRKSWAHRKKQQTGD